MATPDIRRVDPEEWRALRALRLDALRDSPDAFGSTLEHETDADEDAWRGWTTGEGWGGSVATFVADDAGTLVGMATGFRPDDEPAHVRLFAMWVRPDRRNERIGRELVASIARWAAEHPDVDQVLLRVTVSNDAAVRFYAACGFVGTSDPPEPLREGSDPMTQTMRLLVGSRSDEELLRSQIAYYDDRAPAYEDWWFRRGRHDRGQWVNDRWFAETAIGSGIDRCDG